MKKYLFLYVTCIFSFVCIKTVAQNSFTINGIIKNENNIALELADAAKIQPSIKINTDEKGYFKVNSSTDFARFYYLIIGKSSLVLIIHPGDSLYLEIAGNDVYKNLVIKGSDDTRLVYEVLVDFNTYLKRLDSLNSEISNSKASGETQKMNEQIAAYQHLIVEKDNFIRGMIQSNSTSLAALLFIDNFKIADEYKLFDQLGKSLIEKYPGNIFVVDFTNRVKSERALAIGSEAPEISLPNPEGEIVNLSSLRGKVVLIDFWASWCGPCRRENPVMVRIYKDYKDKGFEIYGVSLDNSKDKWVTTISTDHMSWIHVSDLKYWNSEAAKTYKVSSIPYTVLLDKEGKIMAKGLRGDSLDKKLSEIFNQ